MARILGVDPGSLHLGWGVLDTAGSRTLHVASGTLHAPARAPLVDRLVWLAAALDEVLARWRPQVAAVESVFYGSNVRSALVLGHARGAVLVTVGRAGLALAEYAPTRIKQAATGTGGADKAQVATMMAMVLGLTGPLEVDTTDALAAAWCHAQAAGSSFAEAPPPAAGGRRRSVARPERRPVARPERRPVGAMPGDLP